jgi:MFS transporter, DHA3 family, macrolide efflux protein
MAILQVLHQRRLALLWCSQVLSSVGDHLYEIAVMWIATEIAGGAAGLVGAAQALPALLFGLLGGVYADRWNRRRTMISVDLARAGAVLTLPLLAQLGPLPLWPLIIVSVVVSSLGALFDPALQASLPLLAGDQRTLQATNAVMDGTRRLARAIGPSLAGLLAAALPIAHFFTLDAVTFAVSAVAVFSLRGRLAAQPQPGPPAGNQAASARADIRHALRLLRDHRLMTYALAGVGLVNIAWGIAFTVGVPLLARQALAGSVGAYGLIVGAFGAGNILSNLVVGSLPIRRRMFVISLGRLALGAGLLLLGNTTSLPLAMLAAGLAALGGPMGEIPLLTMLQSDFPADQIGKIYSLRVTIAGGGALLGLLLAAPVFAYLGVPAAISSSALAVLLVGVLGLLRFGWKE